MRLTDLIEDARYIMTRAPQPSELEIHGLAADSRQVEDGFLFAALPGSRADGRAYIAEAVARGAVAVLAPTGTPPPAEAGRPVALVTDDNPRRCLSRMAARFYARQPHTIAAVTGTNGKTSVVAFARQLWARAGLSAASLGTLGLMPPAVEDPGSLTTPDPVALHRCLAELAAAGYGHLAIEASSHGLDQYRLDGLHVSVAAFTNLSRDHLDYHGGMSAYLEAKLRLFRDLLAADGTAVINADAPEAAAVAEACAARGVAAWTYGRAGRELRLLDQRSQPAGQRLELEAFGRRQSAWLPLVGDFQAANALAAVGLAVAGGLQVGPALAGLSDLDGVPGRLERVAETPAGGQVVVDYAHTPGALETVLAALRPHVRGRLLVVFGCGGDRDPGKRPLMGEVAARLADRTIVTDDNPRGEDAAAIRAQVLAAIPQAAEVGDRRDAIAEGVRALADGDLLLVAGKGHETGQIVGDRVLPFDDRAVVREAVAALGEVRT